MSNDDNMPPPPPPSGDPTPEQGIGSLAEPPLDATAPTTSLDAVPGGVPRDVSPPIDATQVIPTVPSLPEAQPQPPYAEPVVPPAASGAIPTTPTQTLPPEAWYRKSGAVAGILLGFLVVAAVIIFLVVASRDDDNADGVIEDVAPDAVSLVVTRLNSGGQPLNTALSATVAVAPDADAYAWVLPSDGVVGEAGVRPTDGTGRVEFRWSPIDGADSANWTSTVEIAEFIAAEGEQSVTDLAVECSLERDGTSEGIVVEAGARFDEVSDSLDTIGSYSFPNVRLFAGDRVTCSSTNVVADAAPVVTESSTTVPESSTTVPESSTTVPESSTTAPETTTSSTTSSSTTTSSTTTTSTTSSTTTTEPAPTTPGLGAVLAGQSDLTESAALLDRIGLLDELEADDQPFTIFVPTNAAIDALRNATDGPDLEDDEVVREIFEAHVVRGTALDADAVANASEIAVSNGGPQPVDASADPITVGGVGVTRTITAVDGGVVHVLDGVLSFQA